MFPLFLLLETNSISPPSPPSRASLLFAERRFSRFLPVGGARPGTRDRRLFLVLLTRSGGHTELGHRWQRWRSSEGPLLVVVSASYKTSHGDFYFHFYYNDKLRKAEVGTFHPSLDFDVILQRAMKYFTT